MPDPTSNAGPLATNGPLSPIVIPDDNPLVPDWAREAVHRLNMIVAAQMTAADSKGGYGSNAFAFGSGNAQVLLPPGFTGGITVTTPTGTALLQFKNGQAQSVT